jgi:hypothetical protein
MQPPVYPIEGPDQDADLAEQLLGAQRDGLALVLRDLGMEVSRNLAAQEEALQKVTNALKRRIQTSLRGQVKALIPVMDAIHGRVASSLAEQQVALSTLMDQPAFQCVRGEPRRTRRGAGGATMMGRTLRRPGRRTGRRHAHLPDHRGYGPCPRSPRNGSSPNHNSPGRCPAGDLPRAGAGITHGRTAFGRRGGPTAGHVLPTVPGAGFLHPHRRRRRQQYLDGRRRGRRR